MAHRKSTRPQSRGGARLTHSLKLLSLAVIAAAALGCRPSRHDVLSQATVQDGGDFDAGRFADAGPDYFDAGPEALYTDSGPEAGVDSSLDAAAFPDVGP